MATSTYKGYELIATGTESNTWGSTLNASVFNRIDQNLGGIVTISVTTGTTTLTDDQARQSILRITGTLSGNVLVQSTAQGFYFVENLCAQGAFIIILSNGVASVTLPLGRSTAIADAGNGVRIASSNSMPTNTVMPFYQNAAPTQWTKNTDPSLNHAIRIIGGTGGTFGGGTGFTTVFGARTIARNNLPNDTITTTTNGAHVHPNSKPALSNASSTTGSTVYWLNSTTGSTESAGDHTHTIALNGGVTQAALDFDVAYLNMILCTKD